MARCPRYHEPVVACPSFSVSPIGLHPPSSFPLGLLFLACHHHCCVWKCQAIFSTTAGEDGCADAIRSRCNFPKAWGVVLAKTWQHWTKCQICKPGFPTPMPGVRTPVWPRHTGHRFYFYIIYLFIPLLFIYVAGGVSVLLLVICRRFPVNEPRPICPLVDALSQYMCIGRAASMRAPRQ